jgi:hypothetical protein
MGEWMDGWMYIGLRFLDLWTSWRWMVGQLHALTALPPGNSLKDNPLDTRLGGPLEPVWTIRRSDNFLSNRDSNSGSSVVQPRVQILTALDTHTSLIVCKVTHSGAARLYVTTWHSAQNTFQRDNITSISAGFLFPTYAGLLQSHKAKNIDETCLEQALTTGFE